MEINLFVVCFMHVHNLGASPEGTASRVPYCRVATRARFQVSVCNNKITDIYVPMCM